MPTPQQMMDALPPEQREQAANLSNYINSEINAGRTPNVNSVRRMRELVDLSRGGNGATSALPQAIKARSDLGLQNDPDMQKLIQDSAEANAHVADCIAKGLRPDSRALNRIQEIESVARSTLTPEQYNAALSEMHKGKAVMMTNNRAEQAKLNQADEQKQLSYRTAGITAALRESTKDLTVGPVETIEDFHKIRLGETLTLDSGKARLPKAALSEQVQRKYKTTLDTHIKRLDECCQIQDEDTRDARMEQYGFDRKTVEAWNDGGGIKYGLQEKMAEKDKDLPETIEVKPSDSDILHSDILAGFAADKGSTPFDETAEFADRNKDLLNEDSLHGSVARAWLDVEERDNAAAVEAEAVT